MTSYIGDEARLLKEINKAAGKEQIVRVDVAENGDALISLASGEIKRIPVDGFRTAVRTSDG